VKNKLNWLKKHFEPAETQQNMAENNLYQPKQQLNRLKLHKLNQKQSKQAEPQLIRLERQLNLPNLMILS
jgi:hypothetical protein